MPQAMLLQAWALMATSNSENAREKVRWRTTVICNEFWVANCAVVLLGRDDFFKLFDVMFDWSAPTPYVDIESAGTMRARAAAAAT